MIDGRPVELTQRPRSVLLRLLQEPNRRVSWEQVADFLWGDDPPKTQRNSVARFVADLRQALGAHGDRIVTEGGGYRVVVERDELDLDAARSALAEAKHLIDIDVELAHDRASGAMARVGTTGNPWLLDLPNAETVLLRNDELRIEVLDLLAELKLRTGRHAELVALLEEGVESHPYNEALWAHLVDALQRGGRTADALRACQRLRAELAEIGLEPGDTLVRLEARVAEGQPMDSGPNLDAEAPTGRQLDLASVESALAASRLVTVVGLAGSGKSWLLDLVRSHEERSGVVSYSVDIRAVSDASRVIPAIAAAVGVPASEEVATAELLARHLKTLSCLIVLDNCEHLRPQCAAAVEVVVASALGVRVLASSREPLRVDGEHVHRLAMLATRSAECPSTPSEAAALFAHLSCELSEEMLSGPELAVVEDVCDRLHGHPLALRLAAGFADRTSLKELASALSSRPVVSAADAPGVMLDVAWDSLTPPQQALFARLSVFGGGCTATAAGAVCADGSSIEAALDELVAGYLVSMADDGRCRMDGPVREFASARLADRRERSVAGDRLVDWLRSLTAPWGLPELLLIDAASSSLLDEQANLIEALAHLEEEGRREELAWFALRCVGTWINHGMHSELVRWLRPVVDDEDVSDAARSAAATALLEADMTIGDFSTLPDWGERALSFAAGEPFDWIPGLTGFLALVSLLVPMPLSTDEFLDIAEDAAEKSESRDVNRAMVLMRRAQIAHHRQQYDDAVALFRRALELCREPGRLLLAVEMGETISLFVGGRREEALATVEAWRSRADTDEWHYQVDVVGAIVRGACGDPDGATGALASALRRHEPISVWARANEFQTAFGLLASFRGEQRLSDELLATPLSGSPFLSTIVAAHVAERRGLGEGGMQTVLMELHARTIPEETLQRRPGDAAQLLSWWESGQSGPGLTEESIASS